MAIARRALPMVPRAHWIDCKPKPCAADRVHLEHLIQVIHIRGAKIVAVRGGGATRLVKDEAFHTGEISLEMLVCLLLNPSGDVKITSSAHQTR